MLLENHMKLDEIIGNDIKSWFGNSQIVDHNEEPLLCYHGTGKNIDQFASGWWTGNKRTAQEFGDKIYCAYLKIERPAEEDDLVSAYNELTGKDFDDYYEASEDAYTSLADYVSDNDQFKKLLISKGFDGLSVYDDTNHNPGTVYVPFYPARQVKVVNMLEEDLTYDNVYGLGATGYNANIDYRGIRVKMKPSVFLELALSGGFDTSYEIEKKLEDGEAIGAPFLLVAFPDEWSDGDYSKQGHVVGHEGRNRMRAIKRLYGDIPVEVHIIGHGQKREVRGRHMTPDVMAQMNKGLYKEDSKIFIQGPLFTHNS
jgi:hypothetical protein